MKRSLSFVAFAVFVFAIAFMFSTGRCYADNSDKIVGTWKLVSFESELQDTGEKKPILGKDPTGYLIVTGEGRSMVIMAGEGRQVPKTDQDRAALLKSTVAYTGMYRLEGDKMITKVDVSWNHEWTGTEVVRFLKFDGDRVHMLTGWHKPVLATEKTGLVRAILTWERVK